MPSPPPGGARRRQTRVLPPMHPNSVPIFPRISSTGVQSGTATRASAASYRTSLYFSPVEGIELFDSDALLLITAHQESPHPLSLLFALTTLAFDTFDGDSLVDTAVVSSVYWTSLKTKMISVVLGQLLAAIAFAALSSVMASSLPRIGEMAAEVLTALGFGGEVTEGGGLSASGAGEKGGDGIGPR